MTAAMVNPWDRPFAVSRDGSVLAWREQTAVILLGVEEGFETPRSVQGAVIALAPDGTSFLHGGDFGDVQVSAVDAASSTDRLWSDAFGETLLGFRRELGPEVVWMEDTSRTHRVWLREGVRGERVLISEFDTPPAVGEANGAYAADGSQVAIWLDWSCIEPSGGFGSRCPLEQWVLLLVDVVEGTSMRIGSVQVDMDSARPGSLSFSPDGAHLAYITGNRLFVQSLP